MGTQDNKINNKEVNLNKVLTDMDEGSFVFSRIMPLFNSFIIEIGKDVDLFVKIDERGLK